MKAMRVTVPAVCVSTILALASVSAFAGSGDGVRTGKDGTVVTLPVTATVELANDQAVVNFYTVEVDKDLATATKRVIDRVNKGLTELKALGLPVEFETQSMSSYPRYSQAKNGEQAKIVGWEVRQNISGTVKDVSAAAPLAQKVGEYFAFERVNFTLSREAQQKVQDDLMRAAVMQARQQAEVIAISLGAEADDVRIESMDFNASNIERYSNRMYAALAADSRSAKASVPVPVFEPGQT
ncbi:MAG: SIMPL domain-containing protein, partial [Sutterellaceae bacterium]|nr:SIMPL domain-containing protein [Sutterellaceae bacterium]